MTSDALEAALWKLGTKKLIANLETDMYKGGAFYDSVPPPNRLFNKYDIETAIIDGSKVYTLSVKDQTATDTIYYLHGGGFACGLSLIHWEIITFFADRLGYKIVIPDYPLIPKSDYIEIYDFILNLYKEVSKSKGRIFVVGDSAGASLVLGLSQLITKHNLRKPEHLIMISPWMDVAMTNPEIETLQPIDPSLDCEGLKYAGQVYSMGDLQSPLVSPIYGDYTDSAPMTLIVGTLDLLYPDCHKFSEICKEKGVNLSFYEYENMVHLFPLFNIPQAKEAREIMIAAMQ